MPLAFSFREPLLLLGLLAAAIPLLLHLLSSVRAQEVYFPTLRFLKLSMEKTARRRRIQHWLLLLIRTGLLAILCLAVADPISKMANNWLGGGNYSAAVVVDNSLSMSARDAQGVSRFDRAKMEASALLGGDERPKTASLIGGDAPHTEPTARLDTLRDGLAKTTAGVGAVSVGQQFKTAADGLLKDSAAANRAVYLFSDLQRASFQDLLDSDLSAYKGVHLFIINTAAEAINHVGIADLQVAGRRAVDAPITVSARLVNSSPRDKIVDVGLRIDGQEIGPKIHVSIPAAGEKEDTSLTVRFPSHRFAKSGSVAGEVYIVQEDDLTADHVRRFCLDIGQRVNALVVRGPREPDQGVWMDPAAHLLFALNPMESAAAWPIVPKVVEADAFIPDDLAGVDAAFFSDVPAFTPEQAAAAEKFVREGGTAVLFMGPSVNVENYNARLAKADGLLGAPLGSAIGEVGATARAQAVTQMDISHPYLAGIWSTPQDYYTPPIQVQRYFRLAAEPKSDLVLARLAGGDPMLVVRNVGRGRSVLCTTATAQWSNFSRRTLFAPMMIRMCLLARADAWSDATYQAGAQVSIHLPSATEVDGKLPVLRVALPSQGADVPVTVVSVPVAKSDEGFAAAFTQTALPGIYRWSLSDGTAGAFAVNPAANEVSLRPFTADEVRKTLTARGLERVYIGANLGETAAQAAQQSQDVQWWDVLVAVVIVLLVAESVIANRRSARDEVIPQHLNPKVA